MSIVIYILGSYLLGSIPFGLLIAKKKSGVDIRTTGSGNIGATNVMRSAGKMWAVITLMADMGKAVLPTLLAGVLFPENNSVMAMAGFAAVIGHCFPAYLRFKGGKGVASAFGVFLVLAPKAIAVGAIAFVLIVMFTKIVSIGSLVGITTAYLIMFWGNFSSTPALLCLLMILMIYFRHRDNLVRLLKGQENRFNGKRL